MWHTTTLADEFGVADADEDDLYAAMDWLLSHQDAIQKKLASRHLREGGLVLYDLSSSYFEGSTCPLAKLGYNRDGKKGLHADRGAAMRSKPVASLLVDLDVAESHSRPHVSDDNPYSESQFKTMKYRPEFPERFGIEE